MNRSLYTGATGMMTQMKIMDVVSNNIANVNTTGFKKDDVIARSFNEELMYRIKDNNEVFNTLPPRAIGTVNLGVTVDEVFTNHATGSMQNTNNEFDLAIQGSGYFVAAIPQTDGTVEQKLTRAGNFTLNQDRELVTIEGYHVLGRNGIITIPEGESQVSINQDGEIFVGEQFIDRVQIVDVPDKDMLRKYGDNFYELTADGVTQPVDGSTTVLQGYLETSNVSAVDEMVKMITVQRMYEANQKVITTADSIMQKSANEVGRK